MLCKNNCCYSTISEIFSRVIRLTVTDLTHFAIFELFLVKQLRVCASPNPDGRDVWTSCSSLLSFCIREGVRALYGRLPMSANEKFPLLFRCRIQYSIYNLYFLIFLVFIMPLCFHLFVSGNLKNECTSKYLQPKVNNDVCYYFIWTWFQGILHLCIIMNIPILQHKLVY